MSKTRITLSDVIKVLKNDLREAHEESKNDDFKFITESVEIELAVEIAETDKVSAGFEFWIVKFGGEQEDKTTSSNKIKLILKPDPITQNLLHVGAISDKPITN